MQRAVCPASGGQSIIEYALLTGVVAAAVFGMHTYVQRSVNANMQNLQEEINASVDDTNQTTPPEDPTNPGPGPGGPDGPGAGPPEMGGDPIGF